MFSFRRYFDPSWGVSSPRKCCLTFIMHTLCRKVRCLASSSFSASSAAACMSMILVLMRKKQVLKLLFTTNMQFMGKKQSAPGAPAGIAISVVLSTCTFAIEAGSQDLDHASSKLGLSILSFPFTPSCFYIFYQISNDVPESKSATP